MFSKVRNISGKFSPHPPPVLVRNGETVADPMTVAANFAGVSRRDPAAPGARYRQDLEAGTVDLTSPGGESY